MGKDKADALCYIEEYFTDLYKQGVIQKEELHKLRSALKTLIVDMSLNELCVDESQFKDILYQLKKMFNADSVGLVVEDHGLYHNDYMIKICNCESALNNKRMFIC